MSLNLSPRSEYLYYQKRWDEVDKKNVYTTINFLSIEKKK